MPLGITGIVCLSCMGGTCVGMQAESSMNAKRPPPPEINANFNRRNADEPVAVPAVVTVAVNPTFPVARIFDAPLYVQCMLGLTEQVAEPLPELVAESVPLLVADRTTLIAEFH